MKLNLCSLGFILCLISFSAAADEDGKTGYGITFTSANQLLLRKTVTDSVLVFAGIGLLTSLSSTDSTPPTPNVTDKTQNLILGARYYLTTTGLSKFINLEGSRINTTTSAEGFPDQIRSTTTASVTYGIEYKVASNFSVEGSAGVGYNRTDTTYSTFSSSTTNYSYPAARLALTYYW